MNKQFTKLVSHGLLFAMVLQGALAFAQETAPDLETQLESKVIQLQKIRSTRHQKQQSFLENQEKLKNQIQNLTDEKNTLQNGIAHEQNLLADQNQQIKKHQKFITETQTHLAQLAQTLTQVAQTIQTHIAHGNPYNKTERLQKLDSIIADLKNPQLEIATPAIQNFLIFLSQELNTIQTVEIWNNFFDLENHQKKHAYQFRIGLIFQAFVTEDQTAHGLATPYCGNPLCHTGVGRYPRKPSATVRDGILDPGLHQGETRSQQALATPEFSSELTPKQIKQLNQALRTLQKRRAPELANLPFYYHAH